MTYLFDEFELDPAQRELRVNGEARPLQPQVFDLLRYLIEQHARVVPKAELLEQLWPDTIVTESSLQRAVSLARSALGDRGPELIQTFPRQGYRFVGKIAAAEKPSARPALRPRYAQSGDVHIAFTTLGEGDVDIVVVNGWILPMRAMFQHPKTRGFFEALSQFGRVITFDKRGTGLSDRVKELPPHEQRMDDLRVVLDACNVEQALLIGFSEGGALAMLYAATHPERVRGLLLCGAFARMTRTTDFPCGWAPEEMDRLKAYIRGGWGRGASLRPIAPEGLRQDSEFLDWVAFAEQEGTSPGGALDFLQMNMAIDLRATLPAIRVPTAVLQVADDRMIHPGNGAYLAKHIPGAHYVEVEGSDHVFFFERQDQLLANVKRLLEHEPAEVEEDRFLSTVLVGSGRADQPAWLEEVTRFGGVALPDEQQAYFDGPIRAIRCGAVLARRLDESFGVHAGAVVRLGSSVRGQAFDLAEAIAGQAPAGEVWVSRVLVDLVPGSDLRFDQTGGSVAEKGWEIPLFSLRVES